MAAAQTQKTSHADLWLILLLAAVLRLWALDLKAPHFDEGINGWFADRLRETGTFVYDPTNYHGPWHFYALFVSQSLLGRTLWALRLPVVAASLLCIPVLFMFGRWFGRSAVRWAALAFAVSPACVFYGRYSIHEPWFVLFTMLFTWGAIALWLDRSKAGLWAAVAGLTGMILNKETWVMHAGSLALAAAVFAMWKRISSLSPETHRAAGRQWTARDVWAAAGVSAFLLVFFYSGNFFHPQGLSGPFETLAAWTRTGVAGNGHEKVAYDLLPFVNYYWLALLARYEWPALIGLAWSVRYIGRSPAVPRLLAIYAAGILLAYSLVPYKTPWCVISILWPWLLFFGAAVEASARWRGRLVGILLLVISLAMTLRLNFREYENDGEPYVYVQTYNSISTVTRPLLRAARHDPRLHQASGAICIDSYYPLPWILGDFPNIAYHGGQWPASLADADFIVVASKDAEKARALAGSDHVELRFRLRSGMEECTVFFSPEILKAAGGDRP